MITVNVKASKEYPVYIGSGAMYRAGEFAKAHAPGHRAMLVTDSNVEPLYGTRVRASLEKAGYEVFNFVFRAGEKSKCRDTLFDLLESAAEAGLTRSDIFVALGGGVTGDLCGLAASLYMRGVPFVQIPTTLLAAVDSSVGGKTAIDLNAGKNLCGTFWQPACVICDPDALLTLLPQVYADGMAEVIKYGVICSPDIFETVKNKPDPEKIGDIIASCVQTKADVVADDEFDRGRRALLNLGHTFGHAIEKCSDFTISHGSAVAIGMLMSARVSAKLGFCDPECIDDIKNALINNELPVSCGYSAAELAKAALSDKKKSGNAIAFVLMRSIGNSFTYKIDVEELEKIFQIGLGE